MTAQTQPRAPGKGRRGKGPAAALALKLDLGTARDNSPLFLEAGGLFVEYCSGDLYARVNGPNGDGINLRTVKRIVYPISSIFLTNTAQTGKAARILISPSGLAAEPVVLDDVGDPVQVTQTFGAAGAADIAAPASGRKLRIKAVILECSAAVTYGLKFTSSGTIYYIRSTAGPWALNLIGCNIEGDVDQHLYLDVSGACTIVGTILKREL
jgi:hypothetical protein